MNLLRKSRIVCSNMVVRNEAFSTLLDTFSSYDRFDFRQIREANRFFVDNSRYIRQLERAGDALLFVRPPRFGKSLFVSMLKHYYDVAATNKDLFTGLDIGQAPTSLAHSFYILKLDFSISIHENIEANFSESVLRSLRKFRAKYNLNFDILDQHCETSLLNAGDAVKTRGGKLYIMIDEYDRFANELLASSRHEACETFTGGYNGVIEESQSPPSSLSLMRSFLQTVRTMCNSQRGSETRLFMTGVLPLLLADASGFNIAKNVTLHSEFSSMIGFQESELQRALSLIDHLTVNQQQQSLLLMKKYFKGYLFAGGDEPLYNPTSSLNLLHRLTRRKVSIDELLRLDEKCETNNNRAPIIAMLIGHNVGKFGIENTSSSLFLKLLRLAPNGERLVRSMTRQPARLDGSAILDQFALSNLRLGTNHDDFLYTQALLYYHGIVTFGDERFDSLKLPNEIVRQNIIECLCDLDN